MLKTIESEVSRQAAPPALQAEFAQHDFERLRTFCSLTYIVSVVIWLMFDVIVSTKGGQGFTGLSLLIVGTLIILTIPISFLRTAQQFNVLNVFFVLVISIGIRLLIEGLPEVAQAVWLTLATSSILYSASILPLSRWGFIATAAVTGVVLSPFLMTEMTIMDLRGSMVACYYVFLASLTTYCFFKLRHVKLLNYTLSKLLVEQAYVDALTEIPNRRSFMTRAGNQLGIQPRVHDHYLAMIDIDNFKKVNDQFGHDIGDEVLKRTAANIKAVMQDHEYARLGGEEFAVYVSGVRREDVEVLMDALCRQVREDPYEYSVTISIGLARVADNDTLNQSLAKADKALYVSKNSGKDRFTFHAD
ncbi:GGDEF domain-containing protein [Pseudomonas sp. 7P_10.2_Bac1]|uniref:GGDEF domain-containing protein n=1 Tax=Pseudomonas sp. 7P_10.2_Bac1 TaxID=2971614 RepID=UPI0021C61F8E|nr:GGDEF domain-containing protein [Pseudomonas sp. 7P_10.2_Bac1]MCU1729717.1 GGDEF domain-containing protein [Pseudomonas sp. 7P_10.2_Bac1]